MIGTDHSASYESSYIRLHLENILNIELTEVTEVINVRLKKKIIFRIASRFLTWATGRMEFHLLILCQ